MYSGVVVFPDEIEGLQEKGRRVAVKKVNAEGIMASLALIGDDGEKVPNNFLEAIKREINVLSSFRHPNIIRLVGYCLPPTQGWKNSEQRMKELCLVYELAPLGGLNALLKNDSKASMMLWQHRLNIAVGAAKGLCCMHNNIPDRPAYHRDIKAANIAIMDDYAAKIIDCGLSKYVPENSTEGLSLQSSGSSRYGTPGYMCPYYCKRNMKFDARCEIFSFGILLLELTTGLLQGYSDGNGNQIFLEESMENDDTPLLSDRRIKWPDGCVKELLSIAEQCVASYQKRFQNMVTVMRQLVSINKRFYTPTPIEEDLIKRNSALKAMLQAIELKDEVRNLLKREATHVCQICFDTEIPASKGAFCSNLAQPHFFCGAAHNDCFSDMVLSQAGDQRAFDRNDTSIVCAYCIALVPKVRSSFDLSLIGKQANGKALGAFVSASKDVVHAKGVVAQEKQQLEHRDEIQKLKEEHIDDKAMKMKVSAERHRLKIIEDILTLHCPHPTCNLAIIDFDGCFAVQHREFGQGIYKQGCGLYFCGWCLKKCETNKDCHNHVKACEHSMHAGSIHGTKDEFVRTHVERQRPLVQKYFQENVLDIQEREAIKSALGNDLISLGIDI